MRFASSRPKKRSVAVAAAVLAVAVVAGGSASASSNREAQRAAVTGVEVTAGPGAGELSVARDAHSAARYETRRSRWSAVAIGVPLPLTAQVVNAPVPDEPLTYARAHPSSTTISMERSFQRVVEGGRNLTNSLCLKSSASTHDSGEITLEVDDSSTAVAGDDYESFTTSLTMSANQTLLCIPITLREDDLREPTERLEVRILSADTSLHIDESADTFTLEITDNEPYNPLLSISARTGVEGGQNLGTSSVSGEEFGNVLFDLRLDRPYGAPITLALSYGGTAEKGLDFIGPSSFVFPQGKTAATLKVPIIDDSVWELGRGETVTLTANGHAQDFSVSASASGLIRDNEPPPEDADYVGQTAAMAESVSVGESWYHGRTAVGGHIDYRLGAPRDVDWYHVELAGGSCYEIDVRGLPTWQRYLDGDFPVQYAPSEPLTLAHPFIQGLYDSDGNYIQDTQDQGYLAYPESTVTIRPRHGGTYYIAVTNRFPYESGTFDLSVIDLGSATLTCTYID